MQAAEALKLLMGIEQGLAGKLLSLDALNMHVLQTRIGKDPACPACAVGPAPDSPGRN